MYFLKSLCFIILVFSSRYSLADQSTWQVGLGLGSQMLADYRGSSQYQLNVLPFPYVVHHGKYLKVDREGVRGDIFSRNGVELNISVDAALNGDSEGNTLREGMPEIHSAIEIGPSININLSGEEIRTGWSLRLPIRKVFAVDVGAIEPIGYVFNPKFTWRRPQYWMGWTVEANIGLLYGSQKYHDYYYSVAQPYVTETRSYFEAEQGYSGHYFKISSRRKVGPWWFGAYLRYDNLSNAKFRESPLVEDSNYVAIGLGFARTLTEF